MDKARFLSLQDDQLRQIEGEAGIRIIIDKEAKTLVIEDDGVGMNRDEIIENLGTIAQSGTKSFAEKATLGVPKLDRDAAILRPTR